MWKSRDDKPVAPAVSTPMPTNVTATPTPKEVRPMEIPKSADNYRADVAHIGKSVLIKGELSGSEDLYLDGEVEGNIFLKDHSLTVGPNGRVRANIQAKDVVVHGKVDGNVQGTDRVELKKSAVLSGDISTQRIVIEDGAFFKGAIDIRKESGKNESKREMAAAASAGTGYSGGSGGAVSVQRSLVDAKFEPKI